MGCTESSTADYVEKPAEVYPLTGMANQNLYETIHSSSGSKSQSHKN